MKNRMRAMMMRTYLMSFTCSSSSTDVARSSTVVAQDVPAVKSCIAAVEQASKHELQPSLIRALLELAAHTT
jgi:hypothetical protein